MHDAGRFLGSFEKKNSISIHVLVSKTNVHNQKKKIKIKISPDAKNYKKGKTPNSQN